MTAPIARTNSQVVRSKIAMTCGDAHVAFSDFCSRPHLPAVTPAMLVLIHQIMRTTAP